MGTYIFNYRGVRGRGKGKFKSQKSNLKNIDEKGKSNVIPAEAGIHQGKAKRDWARCWIPD
jgi:hypothetical protein